jgi:hypothetical protein
MIGPVSSSISNVGQLFEPRKLTSDQNKLIEELLSKYDSGSLSESDIQAINNTFREQGIQPSKELKSAIEAAGFNPAELKPSKGAGRSGGTAGGQRPPPPPPRESSPETVSAFLDLLSEYEGQALDAKNLNEIQQKWTQAGYSTSGSFISVVA